MLIIMKVLNFETNSDEKMHIELVEVDIGNT